MIFFNNNFPKKARPLLEGVNYEVIYIPGAYREGLTSDTPTTSHKIFMEEIRRILLKKR